MALTYLDVTNIVLREVNEVPMTEQQFINARGLQQFAKQAVNRAYLEIVNSSREWPWLLERTPTFSSVTLPVLEGELVLDIDTTLYNQVDWDSMYITDKDLITNDPLVTREISKNLGKIEYDEWVVKYREDDMKEDNEGALPEYVFMHPNKNTIGLTPKPDRNLWLQFNAWKVPAFLELPTDTLPFEDKWYTVVVSKARYYMWLFRENPQQAAFAKNDAEVGLMAMKGELLSAQTVRMRAI